MTKRTKSQTTKPSRRSHRASSGKKPPAPVEPPTDPTPESQGPPGAASRDLQRQAEFLLDEMALSGADSYAADEDLAGPARAAGPEETVLVRLQAEIESFIELGRSRSVILPESKLPPVRSKPQDLEPGPARGSQGPSEAVPSPRSRGLNEPVLTLEEATKPPPPPQPQPSPQPAIRPMAGTWPSQLQGAAPQHPNVRELPPVSVMDLEARKLEEEIAALYEEVNRILTHRPELTNHSLALLREARTIVKSQPERMGKAEYNIRQVRSLLERARETRAQARMYGARLMVYLSAWLFLSVAAFAFLFLYRGDVERFLVAFMGGESNFTRNAVPLAWALLAGGIGGVIGAVISLANHLGAGMELDSQYVVRFVIQPIMGLVLGLVSYLLFGLIYNATGFDPVGILAWDLLPTFLALVAGVWQEMVYGLLYRFIRLFQFGSRRR